MTAARAKRRRGRERERGRGTERERGKNVDVAAHVFFFHYFSTATISMEKTGSKGNGLKSKFTNFWTLHLLPIEWANWPASLTCCWAGFGQILSGIAHWKTHADWNGDEKNCTHRRTHTHARQPARQCSLLFVTFFDRFIVVLRSFSRLAQPHGSQGQFDAIPAIFQRLQSNTMIASGTVTRSKSRERWKSKKKAIIIWPHGAKRESEFSGSGVATTADRVAGFLLARYSNFEK